MRVSKVGKLVDEQKKVKTWHWRLHKGMAHCHKIIPNLRTCCIANRHTINFASRMIRYYYVVNFMNKDSPETATILCLVLSIVLMILPSML